MYSSDTVAYRKPMTSKFEFNKTTIILFLIGAALPFLPEAMDKFSEFANNTMRNGYKLHIKAGPVDFTLEQDRFSSDRGENV